MADAKTPLTGREPRPQGLHAPWIHRHIVKSVVITLAIIFFCYHRALCNYVKPYASSSPSDIEPGDLGAVASESAICSRIGVNILARGGNAADAVIASTLCVGVVGMYHSGIGGGGFAVIRSPDGSYETIDFREAAPMSAHEDMFHGNVQASITGGLASGVPGELRGLEYIYHKYGSLPWKDLVQPAVQVARRGFIVGEDLERCINASLSEVPKGQNFLTADSSWAIDFAPNGNQVVKGDRIFRKRYADTLELIGTYGAEIFYNGRVGEQLLKTINDRNGSMTPDDFRQYSVRNLHTSNITYHGHRLFSTTAPSSGAIALSVFKIAEGFDDFFSHEETLNRSTHRMVESMRFAYGQRAKLGDPSFLDGLDEYQTEILSNEIAARNRDKISDDHTLDPDEYIEGGIEPPQSHGTSQVSTVDHTGLSISLTTTINLLFGSRVMDLDTGIILNNVMNDFSIPRTSNEYGYAPSPANYIRPGKRPLSSTTPIFVEDLDGTLELVIGAAGGSRIISSTVQNIIHVLHRNMTMAEALAQPRLHDQVLPNETGFEALYDPVVKSFMASRGHNTTLIPSTLSASQGIIRRSDGKFDAGSEPRQKDSGAFAI